MKYSQFNDLCLVCNSGKLEPLLNSYSRYYPDLFHKVAICQDCGHVQQYPLYTHEEYEKINTQFFSKTYMVQNSGNKTNNERKLGKIKQDLNTFLKKDTKALDVGAGEAWAMEYLSSEGLQYFAIEAVDKLSKSIQDRGGQVVARSIFDDLSGLSQKFDLIIFRHILEHLLSPLEALKTLGNLLSDDGILYIALPNLNMASIKKGFRTSFIRPVHISYFCVENVKHLTQQAGFDSIFEKIDGEITLILRKDPCSIEQRPQLYERQKAIVREKEKQSYFKDTKKILLDYPRACLARLF